MRAAPLFQPWASLVAAGVKQVETRSYPPSRFRIEPGDRFAVYAAKTLDGGVSGFLAACDDRFIAEALEDDIGRPLATPGDLPRGAIVCTCVLKRASAMTAESIQALQDASPREAAFGHYAVGRWAWVLTDVHRFRPAVPATTNHQGAFDWWPPGEVPEPPAQGVLL